MENSPPKTVGFDALLPWQGIPVHSKFLELQPVVSKKGECGRWLATYGVFFGEEEFIEKVSSLTHPFNIPLSLDEPNLCAMSCILSHSYAEVARYRSDRIKHYIDRANVLCREEQKLHLSMRSDLRPVMKSKRLLLFKEMLDDAGVCDEKLFRDMTDGFKLIGDRDPSGQFQSQWKPASLSSDQLAQTAKWAQPAVVSSCKRARGIRDRCIGLGQVIGSSWSGQARLKGPFTAGEVSESVGPDWIPARRFDVRQGGKIRPVDDFSQFLINLCVSCHEKIDLEGIDHIAATTRFFMGAADQSGSLTLGQDEVAGMEYFAEGVP